MASLVFRIMMFPHNGKIFTLGQLIYYYSKPQTNLNNVMPTLGGSKPITSYTNMSPSVSKSFTLLGTYHGPLAQLSDLGLSFMCFISSSNQPLATLRQPLGMPIHTGILS